MKDEVSLVSSLAGELDEGLLALRESDRQALMLRYFEGRSHREIGELLGAREDAVRMRIEAALARLTQFFRRRGYAVPAVATTIAVLGAASKAAPAGCAAVAARSALAASGGSLSGLKLWLAKFMGLTKAQTAFLCIVLAAAPVAWEWNVKRSSLERAAPVQARLEALGTEQAQVSEDLARLRDESARLDANIAEALSNGDRYESAARKLAGVKARVRGLLTEVNYRWPDDLPYVRVRKETVKSLKLRDAWPGTLGPRGNLTDPALELLGITEQEKGPVEQSLANYWHGVEDLMAVGAYETNVPAVEAGRATKTVIVPPLGQPVKTLANDTRAQLTQGLGAEREQLLFGGWDQGGIQIFWPGNLWDISEVPQILDAWVEPAPEGKPPRFGGGWHQQGGSGWSSIQQGAVAGFPRGIATRFFTPWLAQFGITPPAKYFGDADE
jgi:hypothetical protein